MLNPPPPWSDSSLSTQVGSISEVGNQDDHIYVAVSSSPRPWIGVFALPEKSNMVVTESDPDPKVRKMSITL